MMERDQRLVFPMGPERKPTRVRAAFFKVARCPYCHEEVDAEWEDWVQCARCHALQHRSCWGELACCATCWWARTTADYVAPAPPRRRFWTHSRTNTISSGAAMAVMLLVIGFVTAPRPASRVKAQPFATLSPAQVAVLREAERFRIEQAQAEADAALKAAAERAEAVARDAKARRLRELREQWELIEAQRRKEDAEMFAQGAYWLQGRANGVAGDPDSEWQAVHGTSKIK